MKDAYLVIWHESGDEIHMQLHNKESFEKI